MTRLTPRLSFFIGHLSLSLLISMISMALVFYFWYPAPLHIAMGVSDIFLLMLAIDMILGPILAFIVYNPQKKSLKFDLGVIILIQASALMYGLYNVYIGRPLWLVYSTDRFEVMSAVDIDQTRPKNVQPSWLHPTYVVAIVPKGQQKNMLFDEIFSGRSPAMQPALYQKLQQHVPLMRARAQSLAVLKQYNREDALMILSKYPKADAFVPLKAPAQDMVVLFNKAHPFPVVGIVNLKPWP